MPGRTPGPHGQPLSDDFSTNKMGVQWGFYAGTDEDRARMRYDNGGLVIRAKGQTPADSAPLSFVAGDQAHEFEVTIDPDPDATAGLLLFYSRRLYAGLGITATRFVLHRYGTERLLDRPAALGRSLRVRLRNDRHIVTISYSADGQSGFAQAKSST